MTGHTTGSAPSEATPGESSGLDARYGRTHTNAIRDRVIAWGGAIAIVVVFAAWVIWVAFEGSTAILDSRDIGHQVQSERSVQISYEVSMPAGLTASCALQAQNESHAIVGWKIVKVPASERYTQSFTDTVQTTQRGVTGLIYRCWLT